MESKIIAVDFDGTIVQDAYPAIGKPMDFAFETLKNLQREGYRLILWTCRSGTLLKKAVDFCRSNGLIFYAVNNSFENEPYHSLESSRKIQADIFIDDRNLGGFPGWGEVYQVIKNKATLKVTYFSETRLDPEKKTRFFKWLLL